MGMLVDRGMPVFGPRCFPCSREMEFALSCNTGSSCSILAAGEERLIHISH